MLVANNGVGRNRKPHFKKNRLVDYETGIESPRQMSDVWTPSSGAAADVSTLVHYCRNHARGRTSDSPAFTHVVGEPGEHDRLSFAELDTRARAIAAEIQSRGGVGKPVLVVLDPGANYAASLFGCLYARAIAVPIYPPQMLRLQHTLPRLKAIIENAGAGIMLTDRATIGQSLSSMWNMLESSAIAVDEINASSADGWDGRLPKPDDIALLQYTSGSTGTPRGVVLTHRTLLSNLAAVIDHIHFEGARSVQWVPPYHDMGLIGGILIPIYRGVETVIISPSDFVRNPLLWLRCIDYYDGSSNGAPNFGYELCVRRIEHADCAGLDLSSWKVAIAGAEPVRVATLRRFEEKFARYGFEPTSFCPAFGMAETTVMATGSRLGQPYRTFHVDAQALQIGEIQLVAPESRRVEPAGHNDKSLPAEPSVNNDLRPTLELVSSGTPVAGIQYEIVDPQTSQALPDGQIGELWVRGSSVASGYWRDELATEYAFHARIAPASDEAHRRSPDDLAKYLRTGDLAARVDGELIVTGRLKELIIVAGRNFYPHDIEQIVQSTSEAFKPDTGTALSIDHGDSEEMVVIQELWRPKKFPADELLQEVVAAIAEQAQVTPRAVVLVRSGSLPKTSSGKLRRTDTKQLFLDGELIEIARWESGALRTAQTSIFVSPASAIEQRVAEIWSRILDVDAVGRDDDFFNLGGESLLIANMLVEVSEHFRTSIPMTALFRHPVLKDFAAIVDSHREQAQPVPAIHRTELSLSEQHSLSSAQQRFWLLDQLGQTNAFIHVPVSIVLDRPISRSRLQSACNRMLAWHPMLRARFVQNGQDVWQTFSDSVEIELRSFAGESVDTSEFALAWRDFVSAPLDLANAPLMRVALSNTNSGGSRIDLVLHHLICDAGSLQVLLGELQNDFADVNSENGQDVFATTALRYVDFAAWDAQQHVDIASEHRMNYWSDRLAGMPDELNLPQLSARAQQTRSSLLPSVDATISSQVSSQLTTKIEKLAKSLNMTPSMVYLTAFQLVLARYSGDDDFGITIPMSNRPASELQGIVGCFVNPIVYRAQIDRVQTIMGALSQTRAMLLSDLEHADIPFQNVVAAMGGVRSALRMPLSQVMFLYQPPLPSISRLGEAIVTAVRPDYSAVTAYDISLIVQPGSHTELTLILGEQTARDLGAQVLESIEVVLNQIVDLAAADAKIVTLSTLSSDEQSRIEAAERGPSLDRDPNSLLIQKLREHAVQQPHTIAICDDEQSLSYSELNVQSDRIAAALLAQAVSRGSIVAIEMPRSADTVVAILGIWKAAAAYVPIEMGLPQQRRDQIIADAAPAAVLDQACFDAWMAEAFRPAADSTLPFHGSPTDVAYVMYTSGSTGKPKGVAITQSSLANLLDSFAAQPGFAPSDSMLAVTTMSFDISVLEMFLPLWCGGRVCMTAHRIGDDPEAVIQAIEQSKPTVIQSTPSAFRMLLSANWQPAPAIRLLCGGEPLLPDLAHDLLATNCELWNVYGPTETTVWSMIKRIDAPENITIGRPIANTICRVVDRHGQFAPLGVAGELQIGGDGVAVGYWHDDEQTAARFFADEGIQFYKTGDQVRRLKSGDLEFLARNDRQIKLRGFRIELDEIESTLQMCAGVDRAAVVLRAADVPGGSKLVAFCSGSGNALSTLTHLARSLPDYMIPASIEWLANLPQTPAGKTDYKSLPVDSPTDSKITHAPPQSPLEFALAEMWCEVLGCPSVGRHDHFFDLGGNSLMAAQLFARMRQRFDVQLPLREVYTRPTIATLAEAIVIHRAETEGDELSDLLGELDALSEDEVIRALDKTHPS